MSLASVQVSVTAASVLVVATVTTPEVEVEDVRQRMTELANTPASDLGEALGGITVEDVTVPTTLWTFVDAPAPPPSPPSSPPSPPSSPWLVLLLIVATVLATIGYLLRNNKALCERGRTTTTYAVPTKLAPQRVVSDCHQPTTTPRPPPVLQPVPQPVLAPRPVSRPAPRPVPRPAPRPGAPRIARNVATDPIVRIIQTPNLTVDQRI